MIAAAVPTLMMIGLLALQLITVERQRRIAARQEGRARVSLQAITDQARRLQDGAPRLLGGLERADGLVRALARADSPEAIAEAGELAERLQDADLAGRVEILARATVETVAHVRDLEAIARESLDTARDTEAVARETGSDVEVLKTQTLDFQRQTLAIQRETLALLRRSLEIQEELLVRVRNIDERTGAVVPTAQP